MNTHELTELSNGYHKLYTRLVNRASKGKQDKINGHERVRIACCCETGMTECDKMICQINDQQHT